MTLFLDLELYNDLLDILDIPCFGWTLKLVPIGYDFVQGFPDRSCLPCILIHSRAIQTKTFGVDIGIQDVIFRGPFVYEAHIGGTVMVGAGVFKGFCKGLS